MQIRQKLVWMPKNSRGGLKILQSLRFIIVFILFRTSQGALLLYPLQSCSGKYGGCPSTPQPIRHQYWIHCLPHVAIHIKTSEYMRRRVHIKPWWCRSNTHRHTHTLPWSLDFIKQGARLRSSQIWTGMKNIPVCTEDKKWRTAADRWSRWRPANLRYSHQVTCVLSRWVLCDSAPSLQTGAGKQAQRSSNWLDRGCPPPKQFCQGERRRSAPGSAAKQSEFAGGAGVIGPAGGRTLRWFKIAKVP